MEDIGHINGRTKLIGLLATPIGHSLSPTMHNLCFKKLGLNYAYMAFEVGNEQLADVVTGMRALHVRGFNVSMPNKTKIIPLLDELSEGAQLVGAVNTVVNENGKLIGHNTDGAGYMLALKEEGIKIAGKKMTLLGAGGAATAIAIQAALDGIGEISIFNRKDKCSQRAEEIACTINEKITGKKCKASVYDLEDKEKLRAEICTSDLVTNATGVGMKPLEGLSLIPDSSWLHPEVIVSDVIYTPRKTKLLKIAEAAGCKTMNGLGMMLWQGASAFEMWTGQKMPIEYVKEKITF